MSQNFSQPTPFLSPCDDSTLHMSSLQSGQLWESFSNALPLSSAEPYTVREARIHVRHVRDLLKSLDPSDAFNGVDCNSLSFLSVFTDGDLGGAGKIGTRTLTEGQRSASHLYMRVWGKALGVKASQGHTESQK